MRNATKITKTKDRSHDRELRRHVLDLLSGRRGACKVEEIVNGIPSKTGGTKPPGFLHSRVDVAGARAHRQWDILEFSLNPKHVHRTGPPATGHRQKLPAVQQPGIKASGNSQRLESNAGIGGKAQTISSPHPWGDGRPFLREALLWPITMLITWDNWLIWRRVLGVWPG